MDAVLHSSAKHDWQTPDVVLELVRKVGWLWFDPCTTADNPTKAHCYCYPPHGVYEGWEKECARGFNGLESEWNEAPCMGPDADGLAYCNPEYGRALPRWVAKCVEAGERGCQIILLVPARPDTGWYDAAMQSANALCEWRGRLKFKGAPSCAPFPSALFYWGPNPFLFCHVFQLHGRVRVLRERRT